MAILKNQENNETEGIGLVTIRTMSEGRLDSSIDCLLDM